MLEALDVDEGGAQYLPWAQDVLRRLKLFITDAGLTHGRKHLVTPDGAGSIYVRTRRGEGGKHAPNEWYDYIKITAGDEGYIARIASSLGDEIPLAEFSPYRIGVNTGKFGPFLGYQYPLGLSPQQFPSRVITEARTAGGVKGYFDKGKFAAYANGPSGPIGGTILHKYTDPGTSTEMIRVLALPSSSLVDTHTGDFLTATGASLAGITNPTYTVSRDGRLLVIEGDPTQTEPPQRKVWTFDIDFAVPASQVVRTSIVPAGPFGTQTDYVLNDINRVDIPPNDVQWTTHSITRQTRGGSYPFTFGVGENEDGVPEVNQTTLAETVFFEEESSSTGEQFSGGTSGSGTGMSVLQHRRLVALELPNSGASKEFALRDRRLDNTVQSQFAPGGWTQYDGASTEIEKIGTLGIIYSDPSIPILFYEHNTREFNVTVTTAPVPPLPSPVLRQTFPGATIVHRREVGVLYGNNQRVLFTDTRNEVIAPSTSDSSTGPSPPPAGSAFTESSTTVDITTDQGYFKKLKYVTDFDDALVATPLNCSAFTFGGSNTGELFMRDVEHLTGAYVDGNKYWLSVRDKNRWIFAVFKKKDMSGNVLNELSFYSGNLSGDGLLDRYVAYLTAAAEAADNPDAALIAALEARDFSTYDVTLAAQSRIPIV